MDCDCSASPSPPQPSFALPSPPLPSSHPPTPPPPDYYCATFAIKLAMEAAVVSTPAGRDRLSNALTHQYSTSQNLSLSRVNVSDVRQVDLQVVPARHRQLLASVSNVSATISLFFDPLVENVTSRLASLHADPLAGFLPDFKTSFGITGATAVFTTSPSLPPPSPSLPLSPRGQCSLVQACISLRIYMTQLLFCAKQHAGIDALPVPLNMVIPLLC